MTPQSKPQVQENERGGLMADHPVEIARKLLAALNTEEVDQARSLLAVLVERVGVRENGERDRYREALERIVAEKGCVHWPKSGCAHAMRQVALVALERPLDGVAPHPSYRIASDCYREALERIVAMSENADSAAHSMQGRANAWAGLGGEAVRLAREALDG